MSTQKTDPNLNLFRAPPQGHLNNKPKQKRMTIATQNRYQVQIGSLEPITQDAERHLRSAGTRVFGFWSAGLGWILAERSSLPHRLQGAADQVHRNRCGAVAHIRA